MITNPKFSLILSIVAISLSLMAILNVYFQKPVFATVVMGQLISLQASDLGQQYSDGKVPAAVMQQLIFDLREQIKEVAQEKKVILIAKGAVLTDSLPDYTDLLNESLTPLSEEQVNEEK